MKILALLFLFAMPVEDLTMPCPRDTQPAKFTGRTRQNGYECEFAHGYQGHKHKFWYSCHDARKGRL
jgi:hypothetical protein